MNPPSFIIVVGLERSAPHVMNTAQNDSEYLRLDDWVRTHPKLAEILRLAFELDCEQRA